MPPTSFTVKIPELGAAIAATDPRAFEGLAGEAIEAYIDQASLRFRDEVRARTPIRRGRGSQWERANNKAPGTMRRSVNRTLRRAGFESTARVRVGDALANIVQAGSPPHLIRPRRTDFLFTGSGFASEVQHPGHAPNPFFGDALQAVDGDVRRLSTSVGLATADKMAERIARRSRR